MEQLGKISKKTPLAKAIKYALTRLPKARPYLDYGFLELDNNTAERAIRPVTLGRKNSYDRLSSFTHTFSKLAEQLCFLLSPLGFRAPGFLDGRSNSYSGIGYPMMTLRRKAASFYLRA